MHPAASVTGAAVDAADGWLTALMLPVDRGHEQRALEILLNAGAQVTFATMNASTADAGCSARP